MMALVIAMMNVAKVRVRSIARRHVRRHVRSIARRHVRNTVKRHVRNTVGMNVGSVANTSDGGWNGKAAGARDGPAVFYYAMAFCTTASKSAGSAGASSSAALWPRSDIFFQVFCTMPSSFGSL